MIGLLELALPPSGFRAILADPPWRFKTYNEAGRNRCPDWKTFKGSPSRHYDTMSLEEIAALPVKRIVADDAVLFLWVTCPMIPEGLEVMRAWGFEFKTVAFAWTKAHASQLDMFRDDADALMGTGYWTRANTELCFLGTRGQPKRCSKAVRMGIIEPRREHSRKPDCVHERIEELVAGPYLEMFARRHRKDWTCWGNQLDHTTDFDWLGPDERVRYHILREGRLDAHSGPLFPEPN